MKKLWPPPRLYQTFELSSCSLYNCLKCHVRSSIFYHNARDQGGVSIDLTPTDRWAPRFRWISIAFTADANSIVSHTFQIVDGRWKDNNCMTQIRKFRKKRFIIIILIVISIQLLLAQIVLCNTILFLCWRRTPSSEFSHDFKDLANQIWDKLLRDFSVPVDGTWR